MCEVDRVKVMYDDDGDRERGRKRVGREATTKGTSGLETSNDDKDGGGDEGEDNEGEQLMMYVLKGI